MCIFAAESAAHSDKLMMATLANAPNCLSIYSHSANFYNGTHFCKTADASGTCLVCCVSKRLSSHALAVIFYCYYRVTVVVR